MFAPELETVSKITPTTEQQNIIEEAKKGKNIAIRALAGTSKTTTCRLIAENYHKKTLYIAFNKVNQEEANDSFPSWVEARTWHSLAYGDIVKGTGFAKRGKLSFFVDWKEVGEILSSHVGGMDQNEQFFFNQECVEILKAYCQSEYISIDSIVANWFRCQEDSTVKMILYKKAVEALWDSMSNPKSKYKTIPDIYLKLWQLSEPDLSEYDVIFCDEFQDTNPVCLNILLRQKSQLIVVGDNFQSIYAWRGAVNAFDYIPSSYEDVEENGYAVEPINNGWIDLFLTESFRFPQHIADKANILLSAMGSEKSLVGKGTKHSNTKAYIARNNSTIFQYLLELNDRNLKVDSIVDLQDLFSAMYTVNTLRYTKAGEEPNWKWPHKQFVSYSSWKECFEDKNPEVQKIVRLVQLCDSYGGVHAAITKIKGILLTKEEKKEVINPDLVVTTGHKSKGLQWGEVTIANDFLPYFSDEDEPEEDMMERFVKDQGMNLLYVAITRAEETLNLSPEMEDFLKDLV
jgi:hypothetical protein